MEYTFEYTNIDERSAILTVNSEKFLIAEKNIREGNFLIFTDVIPIEEQISQLQKDNVILMDALATTFEGILNLQSQVSTLQGGTA